jgi:hypothetical protein
MSRDPIVRRVYIFHVWILSLRIVLPHGSDAAAVSLKKRREFHVVHFRKSVFFFYTSRGGGGGHPLLLNKVDACCVQIKTRHGKGIYATKGHEMDVFVKSNALFFRRTKASLLLLRKHARAEDQRQLSDASFVLLRFKNLFSLSLSLCERARGINI